MSPPLEDSYNAGIQAHPKHPNMEDAFAPPRPSKLEPFAATPRMPAVPPAAPPSPPRFIAVATLCMRAERMEDVPLDGYAYKYEKDVLQPTPVRIADIPEHRLKASVDAGVLYVLWGHASQRGEELQALWPLPLLNRTARPVPPTETSVPPPANPNQDPVA